MRSVEVSCGVWRTYKALKYEVRCEIYCGFSGFVRAPWDLEQGHCKLTWSKVYTRCGLTQELSRKGFPRSFIGHWVCLIESESAKDTSKVTNRAKGKYLGLFQIRSKEWCTYEKPGGKCNMKCEKLVDDDITDDAVCAKKVYNEEGFKGWSGWQRNCYGKQIPIPQC
ncbi:C-type lysozyme/alpha-lactalbumin family [Popillia japonica]|uniref:lysozyme n=1 Tax=Popillia japonica TaxID=7064 RepID=A0AAW1L549_POPJA